MFFFYKRAIFNFQSCVFFDITFVPYSTVCTQLTLKGFTFSDDNTKPCRVKGKKSKIISNVNRSEREKETTL